MVQCTDRLLTRAGQRSALCEGSVYAIPWPDDTFDSVVSTFAFSAFVDGEQALSEMIRVTRPGGSVIILDAGEAQDGNVMAYLLAQLWSALGDFMRDERALMVKQGLTVTRQDFGPWHCVHVVAGELPETQS
jgi:ubiquinone/menaquinone biosynthesis C-methylase UbiE